jgi:hypothetical protein
MSEYLDRPSATPSNPSMLHMLQRHKDIVFDYSKELRKVKVWVVHISLRLFTCSSHVLNFDPCRQA